MTELVPVRYHEAARALACPSCGAKSGERCRTAAGQSTARTHGRRLLAAGWDGKSTRSGHRKRSAAKRDTSANGGDPECAGCGGAGTITITCPTCKGENSAGCARCDGAGTVTMSCPNCSPDDSPDDSEARVGGNRRGAGRPSWSLDVDDPTSIAASVVYDVVLHADASARTTVVLTDQAREQIVRMARTTASEIENGGVLIGMRDGSRLLITDAGNAGPQARRTPTRIKRDHLHDIQEVQRLAELTGGALVELGFWHTHTQIGSDRPSGDDLQHFAGMYNALAKSDGAAADRYLGLIVTPVRATAADHTGWREPNISAWVTRDGNPTGRNLSWFVCERAELTRGR